MVWFCRATDANSASSLKFLAHLILQLRKKVDGFPCQLTKYHSNPSQTINSLEVNPPEFLYEADQRTSLVQDVFEPLKTIDLSNRTYTIVIDGIDEIEDFEQKDSCLDYQSCGRFKPKSSRQL